MPKSPEQNSFNEPRAILEAEIILREREIKHFEGTIADLKKALSFEHRNHEIKRLNDLIAEYEKKKDEIFQEYRSFKLKIEKNKLEQEAGCEKCGAATGNTLPFCGACGTKNLDFDEREFKKDMGRSLEEIKKQEGCAIGHPSAVEDKELLSDYCIYCGKKY